MRKKKEKLRMFLRRLFRWYIRWHNKMERTDEARVVIKKATAAVTLVEEIDMDNNAGDKIHILGDTLKFVDEEYRPVFLKFIDKLTKPQNVELTYFLQGTPAGTILNEIAKTCKKNESSFVAKKIDYEKDNAKKYVYEKTRHFMVIQSENGHNCQLWIEREHKEESRVATNCEYIYLAERDPRYKLAEQRIEAFNKDSALIAV